MINVQLDERHSITLQHATGAEQATRGKGSPK
jgi:hypothetical protein